MMAGVGLMGTDFTLEGPFKKGYAGSYLVNYRYSTIGLLQKLGYSRDIPELIPHFRMQILRLYCQQKKWEHFLSLDWAD